MPRLVIPMDVIRNDKNIVFMPAKSSHIFERIFHNLSWYTKGINEIVEKSIKDKLIKAKLPI